MWFGPYSHSGPGLCLIWCSSIRKYCDPFWSWNIRIWDACLGDGPLQTCENMSSLLKNVHALYIYIYTHTPFFQLLPTKLPRASTGVPTLLFYCKFAIHLVGISPFIQQSQRHPQKIKQKNIYVTSKRFLPASACSTDRYSAGGGPFSKFSIFNNLPYNWSWARILPASQFRI